MRKNEKNVLITGAASGIGYATARHFAEQGCRVIAIDRTPLENEENIRFFSADISEEQSLSEVKKALLAECTVLDAIICIAGVHDMVSLVESDFSRAERLININLVGTMRTVGIFHSLLASRGRVVILTSEVATYTPMPFNGLYNISKTALECYADALRQELNLLGQSVVTVRPGAVETPLASGSASATEQLASQTELYKNEAVHFSNLVKSFTGTPIKAEKIARIVYKAATKKHPRYAYSKHRNIGLVLLNILPKRLQCAIIKFLLKRK